MDETVTEGNVPFFINKTGFPVEDSTWDRIWSHAAAIHPGAKGDIDKLKYNELLCDIPIPSPPVFNPNFSTSNYLRSVQNYIQSLQYNHTGTQLFEIKKMRPLAGLMDKAKEMIKEALPIKCLEAVILAIYLTNCLPNVDRFSIGFKSMLDGHFYYHVVLGIVYKGKYGALGISRRSDLMDKPLIFKSLYELIESYNFAYSNYNHLLKKVRIGGIIPHDMCSQEKIPWGICNINMVKYNNAERQQKLDRYGRDLKSHITYAVPKTSVREKRLPAYMLRREHTMAMPLQDQTCFVSRSTQSAHNTGSKSKDGNRKYQLRV